MGKAVSNLFIIIMVVTLTLFVKFVWILMINKMKVKEPLFDYLSADIDCQVRKGNSKCKIESF